MRFDSRNPTGRNMQPNSWGRASHPLPLTPHTPSPQGLTPPAPLLLPPPPLTSGTASTSLSSLLSLLPSASHCSSSRGIGRTWDMREKPSACRAGRAGQAAKGKRGECVEEASTWDMYGHRQDPPHTQTPIIPVLR